jgi:uncharacterized LabA/DUF88 family protein
MKEDRPRLAIFIDAENVGVQKVRRILACLCVSWNVSYRRAYGTNLQAHSEALRENSVIPVEVLCNSPGKNAADIALVIDAMEELCQGPSEAICIVSGDGDFTRLVQRIREKGKTPIVFGKSSSPGALRSACSEFHAIEETQPQTKSKKAASTPARSDSKPKEMEIELEIRNGLRRVFGEFKAECNQVSLERFGELLKRKHPQLSPKRMGLRKLKPFLIRVGGFKIEPLTKDNGKSGGFLVNLPVAKPGQNS